MPSPYHGKNRSLTPYEPFRRANARRRGLISPRPRTLTLEEQIARDEERAREIEGMEIGDYAGPVAEDWIMGDADEGEPEGRF